MGKNRFDAGVVWFTTFVLILCPLVAAAQEQPPYAGLVVDDLGRPVEGAVITAYDERYDVRRTVTKAAETRTASDGTFAIRGVIDDAPLLIIRKEGFGLCWGIGERRTARVFRLDRGRTLAGTVVDPNGRPVANARIGLCLKNELMVPDSWRLPMLPSEPWTTAQTDATGRFAFDNIPAETTGDFNVEALGRAPFWTFCDFGLDEGEHYQVRQTDIRITLPAEARIEGRIMEEDTREPVSGVTVWATPDERTGQGYRGRSVPADPNGHFIVGIAPGSYQLQVHPADGQERRWWGPSRVVRVQAGQTVRDIRLPVGKGDVDLEVLTMGMDGAPLGDVQVTVEGVFGGQTTLTNLDGLARLHVPAGKCTLRGFKAAYGFSEREIELKKGPAQKETLLISRSFVQITGIVVDANERPQALASVTMWDMSIGLTDANGRFEHSWNAIPLPTAKAVMARYEPSDLAGMATFKDPSRSGLLQGTIVLEPAYTIRGRIIDPNGKGLAGARIRLIPANTGQNPHWTRTWGSAAEAATDANGTYSIRGIPRALAAGGKQEYLVITAELLGFNEGVLDPVPIEGPIAEPIRLKPIVLKRTDRAVTGIVVDANDNPVSEVLVETPPASGYDVPRIQLHRKTLTDAKGRFRLDGVCTELLDLVVSTRDGQRGVTHAAGGEQNIKIVLGQTLNFARYLKGTPLPSLNELGLASPQADLEGKAILLCLVDIEQRPCRHMLNVLAQRAEELAKRGVAIRAMQVGQFAPEEVRSKTQEYQIAVPLTAVSGDPEKVRQTLGIQSMPWLILADAQRIVRADGFALPDLDRTLETLNRK